MTEQSSTVDPDGLRRFVADVLADTGMRAADSAVAADAMVETDARGQQTHGCWYLPRYLQGLRGGGIRAAARPWIVRQTPATAVLDGDGGLGAVVAHRACEIAADKARAVGCATVAVRNSNHFGAAGHYALLLARRGCVGLVTANATPTVTAPGSGTRMLGTQPLAWATPDPDGQGPVLLDVALCAAAGTKVAQARTRGEPVPEGWVVDAAGNPSTDPEAFFGGGAFVPLGGHKGYGLAVLAEILSGVLGGGATTHEVRSHDADEPSGTGHCVIALDVAAFGAPELFDRRVAGLRAQAHAAPAGDGHAMLPGEPEAARYARTAADGLELDSLVWDALVRVARDAGRTEQLAALRPAGAAR